MASESESGWSADDNVPTEPRLPTQGHSDDSDDYEGTAAPLEGFVEPPREAFRADGRKIDKPYNARPDVGKMHVLSGNWGGVRSDQKLEGRRLTQHINIDLKKCPALVMCLQEVDEAQKDFLEQPAHPGNPAKAAALRAQAELSGGSEKAAAEILANRPSFRWKTWAGSETGKTLLIAVRSGVCAAFNPLQWVRRQDGKLKDNSAAAKLLRKEKQAQQEAEKAEAKAGEANDKGRQSSGLAAAQAGATAAELRPQAPTLAPSEPKPVGASAELAPKFGYSRLQVAHIRFNICRAGLQDLVLINTHMHHNSAKKAQPQCFSN